MKIARFCLLALGLMLSQPMAAAADTADRVVVYKERRVLQLFAGERLLREYPIALGGDPVGHKRREGDQKTPEGRYVLDWRNDASSFYRSYIFPIPNRKTSRRLPRAASTLAA